jgi:hypothetical protein
MQFSIAYGITGNEYRISEPFKMAASCGFEICFEFANHVRTVSKAADPYHLLVMSMIAVA